MDRSHTALDWRRWLLLLVFGLLTVWVFTRFTGVKDLLDALSQGLWFWVAVGVVVHAVYFFMNAYLYQFGFDTVGVESKARQLLPVVFAVFFVNVVVPSGGAAGGALFIADAVRRGQSGARAAVGTLLVLLADLSTLIPFIAYGMVFLAFQRQLRSYEIAISAIFVQFLLFMVAALPLAAWKPGLLRRVLEVVRGVTNRVGSWFKRPNLVAEDWPEKNAEDLAAAARAIAENPRKLARALGWAFLMHVVNLAGLYAFFIAFRQPVQLGTLVAGFTLGIVVWVVAIIPQGVAAVEGIMALVFTSMGIPAAKAAAIVLAFRGVNFYLPLIFGFFFLRYVSKLAQSMGSPEEKDEPEGIAPAEPCQEFEA